MTIIFGLYILSLNHAKFPSDTLKPYIKSYSVITVDKNLVHEVFYPSGYIDFVVNISEGIAATTINGRQRRTPCVELLGQITTASQLSVNKGTSILIARIHPYAAALFFNNSIADFTNYATNVSDLFSGEVDDFYNALMQTSSIEMKVQVLDRYLIKKLRSNGKMVNKSALIAKICHRIVKEGEFFDINALSNDFGISERYVQKLFLDFVGISPSSFFSVYRFNKALKSVLSSDKSLTSVSYDCGYYDQAHFIREFRKFTDVTPSAARVSLRKGPGFQQAVNVGF